MNKEQSSFEESISKPSIFLKPGFEACFGFYQTPINHNCFILGQYFIYLCGNNIVQYSVSQKTQRFILKNIEQQKITSMAYFYWQDIFIFLGIITFDKITKLKRYTTSQKQERVLQYLVPDYQGTIIEIIYLSKSKIIVYIHQIKNKYFICISKYDDFNKFPVIQFEVNKFNRLAEIYTNDNEFVAYSNRDLMLFQMDLVSQTMMQSEKLWRPVDDLKAFINLSQTNIYIILTKNQLILSYHNQKISSFNIKKQIQYQASCMGKISKGVVVGFSNVIAISIFIIEYQSISLKGFYQYQDPLRKDLIGGVINLHPSIDDMHVGIAVIINKSKQNKLQQIQILSQLPQLYFLELLSFNITVIQLPQKIKQQPFSSIAYNGIHKGNIISVEMFKARTMFATICQNKLLKIYSYSSLQINNLDRFDKFRTILSHQFNEKPVALSIHPTSLMLAVGFISSIRLFFVTENQIIQYFNQMSKGCCDLAYSKGGDILIILTLVPNWQINFYDTFRCVLNKSLNLSFYPRQLYILQQSLISIYDGKKFFIFKISKYEIKKNGQFVLTKIRDQVFVNTIEWDWPKWIVVSWSNGLIETYQYTYQKDEIQKKFEIFWQKGNVTSLLVMPNSGTCIMGGDTGWICIYPWPILYQYQELQFISIHNKAIVKMQLTPDHKHLIIASAIGDTYIVSVHIIIQNKELMQELDYVLFNFEMVQLVDILNLQGSVKYLTELQEVIKNCAYELEQQKQLLHIEHSKKINELKMEVSQKQNKNFNLLKKIVSDSSFKIKRLNQNYFQINKKRIELKEQKQEQLQQNLLKKYNMKDKIMSILINLYLKQEDQIKEIQVEFNNSQENINNELSNKYSDLKEQIQKAENLLELQSTKMQYLYQLKQEQNMKLKEKEKKKLEQELKTQEERFYKLKSMIALYQKQIDRLNVRSQFLSKKGDQMAVVISNMNRDKQIYVNQKKDMEQQLIEKQKYINGFEKILKKMRNKNGHLLNFQKVYNQIVESMIQVQNPLFMYSNYLDQNSKLIYQQLLKEVTKKKICEQKQQKNLKIIEYFKKIMKDRNLPLHMSNLILQLVECVNISNQNLRNMILYQSKQNWKQIMRNLYKHVFENYHTKIDEQMKNSLITRLEQKKTKFIKIEDKQTLQWLNKDLEQKLMNVIQQIKICQIERDNYVLEQQIANKQQITINQKLITECKIIKQKIKEKRKQFNLKQSKLKSFEGYRRNRQKFFQKQQKIMKLNKTKKKQLSIHNLFNQEISPLLYSNYQRNLITTTTPTNACRTIISREKQNAVIKALPSQINYKKREQSKMRKIVTQCKSREKVESKDMNRKNYNKSGRMTRMIENINLCKIIGQNYKPLQIQKYNNFL